MRQHGFSGKATPTAYDFRLGGKETREASEDTHGHLYMEHGTYMVAGFCGGQHSLRGFRRLTDARKWLHALVPLRGGPCPAKDQFYAASRG